MLLFVYGSLKRGEYNHERYGFNAYARFLHQAESSTLQLYQIPDVTYPHAVLNRSQNIMRGEVYDLDLSDIPTAEMFANILRMELDAGYVLANIQYTTPPYCLPRYALTFVATRQLAQLLRDPIYQAIAITEWKGPRHDA